MPKDRGAEQGDIVGHQECSLALETVAAEARLRFAEQHFGLARTTQQTQKYFQTDSAVEGIAPTTSSLEAGKSSSERTIHDILYQKTKTSQTSGTLTSCVAQCWYCSTFKRLNTEIARTGPKNGIVARL